MMNDIVLFDPRRMEVSEVFQFSEGAIKSRIYMCGVKIDQRLYIIGGMSSNGQLLDDFTELDYRNKVSFDAIVEKGKPLIEKMHSATITPVFYEAKMPNNGDLRLS